MNNTHKYITNDIGLAGVSYLDVTPGYRNVINHIPLYESNWSHPVSLGLTYNLLEANKATGSEDFGRGCRLNSFMKMRYSGDDLIFEESDYTSKTYTKRQNDWFNEETQMLINITADENQTCYLLTDKYGNKMYFSSNKNYPYKIIDVNGYETLIDITSDGRLSTITSHSKERAIFTYSTYGVSSISIVREIDGEYEGVKQITFEYTNGTLTKITHHNLKNTNLKKHVIIQTTNDGLGNFSTVFKDASTGYSIKYDYDIDNNFSKITEGYNDNYTKGMYTLISSSGYKTTLTDYQGKKRYIFFDKKKRMQYETDELGRCIYYEFDDRKRLVARSNTLVYNNLTSNLLETGGCANNFPTWDTSLAGASSYEVEDYDHVLKNYVGIDAFKIENTNSMSRDNNMNYGVKVSKTIDLIPTTDELTLYFSYKKGDLLTEFNDGELEVKVSLISGNNVNYFKTSRIKLNELSSWQLKALRIPVVCKVEKCKVEFILHGHYNIILINGVVLTKKHFGEENVYDEKGNLVSKTSASKTTECTYDEENRIKEISNDLIGSQTIHYNEHKKNLITEVDNDKYTLYNTYDAYGNLIRENILLSNGQNIENSVNYKDSGNTQHPYEFIQSETAKNGLYKTYTYDEVYKLITKEKYFGDMIITNDYEYDDWNNLSKVIVSNSSNSLSVEMTYNGIGAIVTSKNPSGQIYKYYYNNYNLLEKVTLINGINESTLIKYNYEEVNGIITGRISEKIYGDDICKYRFIYTLSPNYYTSEMIEVKIRKGTEEEKDYATFYFDNLGRLVRQYTEETDESIELVYDYEDRLIDYYGYCDPEGVRYHYNNLNEIVAKMTYSMTEEKDMQTFSKGRKNDFKGAINKIKRVRNSYLDDNQKNLSNLFINETGNEISYVYGIDGGTINKVSYNPIIGSNLVVTSEAGIPQINCNGQSERLVYNLPLKYNMFNGSSVILWFRPTIENFNSCLVSLGSGENNRLDLYININGQIEARAKNSDGVFYTNDQFIQTTNVVKLNEWNFLAFTWKKEQVVNVGNFLKLKILLNDIWTTRHKTLQNVYSGETSTHFAIGAKYINNTLVDKFNGSISSIIINNIHELNQDECENFKDLLDYFIIDNASGKGDDDVVITNYYKKYSDYILNYDIISMNNNLVSVKDVNPNIYDMTEKQINEKELFIYNDTVKRHVYHATGKSLSYNLGLSESGTVSLKVYRKSRRDYQYILENVNSAGDSFGIYCDKNGIIKLKVNDVVYNTSLTLSLNTWMRVTLAWDLVSGSSSTADEGDLEIRVSIGNNYYTVFSGITSNNFTTYVGIEKESLDNPFYGDMEMLVYTDRYMSLSSINELENNLKVISYTNELDELNLIKNAYITSDGNNILRVEYTKETMDDPETSEETERLTGLIDRETHTYGNTVTNYSYTYDEYKNITTLSKNYYIKKRYSYDYLQRLIEEDDLDRRVLINYSYDNNGNILQIINDGYDSGTEALSFSYENSQNKDLLTKITYSSGDIVTFNYTDTYTGKPISCTKSGVTYNFEWEGTNLISIKEGSLNKVRYDYDCEGKRVQKYANNEYKRYFYDKDGNLVKELGSIDVEYFYDSLNKLYAMKQNDNVYYYVRDLTGTIIGLLNETGVLVAEYKYNAFGKILYNSNPNLYNPFMYKGYYYDEETQLYWVSSRYYSPELCRWISPDCVCYLNPTSINGLNLYSYCYNDPINYIDSSGCYPVRIQVGRLTIYFYPPHGNGPNAQHYIHIKNGNVKIAFRNYDGSVHDKKYGKNYVPSKEGYNALLAHGWDWYGNKFSLFDFSGLYREEFPLQQSGYSLEQFPVTNIGSSVEVFPSLNNGFVLETFSQVILDIPYYNPFPLTNQEKQILVVTAIVIVAVVAIALIPATGGGSAVLLLA